MAVTDGAVHSWGHNGSGQLGLGHFKEQHQPAEVLSLKTHNVSPSPCQFLLTFILLLLDKTLTTL